MNKIIRKLKKSNKALRIIYYLISIIYLIGMCIFIKSLINLKGIETLLRIIVIIFFIVYILLYMFINLLNLLRRNYKGLIITSILSIIFILIFFIGSYYINFVYNNLNGMQEKNDIVYNTYLITLKDKEFTNDSKIGLISSKVDKDNNDLSTKLYKQKNLKNDTIEYEDYIKLISDLYNETLDAVFVPGNYETLFRNEEGFEDILSDTKVVYEYSEKKKNEDLDLVSDKDFTEPLTFLFLGVDSEGDGLNANAAFNGDTLMLVSFNPKTLNAIMLSIPRDTYVKMACGGRLNKINDSVESVKASLTTMDGKLDAIKSKTDTYTAPTTVTVTSPMEVTTTTVDDIKNTLTGVDAGDVDKVIDALKSRNMIK